MIMEILSLCITKECRAWTVKDGYRLGDDIQSKVLAFAFGFSAEIERNLISQRTKEALARKRAEGVILGRSHWRLKQSLNQRITRLENMAEMLYDDKLAGEITKERYDAKKADIQK